MLCTPLGRDQGFNADRVETVGLGMVLDSNATTDVLRQTIQDMLGNDGLRQRAEAFRDSVKTHPGIADALQAIDRATSRT